MSEDDIADDGSSKTTPPAIRFARVILTAFIPEVVFPEGLKNNKTANLQRCLGGVPRLGRDFGKSAQSGKVH